MKNYSLNRNIQILHPDIEKIMNSRFIKKKKLGYTYFHLPGIFPNTYLDARLREISFWVYKVFGIPKINKRKTKKKLPLARHTTRSKESIEEYFISLEIEMGI